TVGVWDVAKGTERHRLESSRSVVIAVEFSTADTLFSGGFDGKVRSWDARTGKPRRGFATEDTLFWGGVVLSFAPGARLLASWEGNVEKGPTAVHLWDSSGKEPRALAPAQVGVNALAFSPDGRLLAVAAGHRPPGKSPCLLLYDVQTGRRL